MWLLNVTSVQLEYFEGERIPPYAILSHRWEDEELSFQDLARCGSDQKKGFRKVRFCCQQARRDGIGYVWIDTCCIDRSNSAELSEAINTMYRWYEQSLICYVYLCDVEWTDPGSLRCSAWFTRGWTLQELLAPRRVIFYDDSWVEMGSRCQLKNQIIEATGIPERALLGFDPECRNLFSVAEIMSWAAVRRATRIEDNAYSLMGLFGVNMPLIYGEGSNAFLRLQHEILQTCNDLSIFAWSRSSDDSRNGLFATSPADFSRPLLSSRLGRCKSTIEEVTQWVMAWSGPQISSTGVQISLQLLPNSPDTLLTPLGYFETEAGERKIIAMTLQRRRLHIFDDYFVRIFPGLQVVTNKYDAFTMLKPRRILIRHRSDPWLGHQEDVQYIDRSVSMPISSWLQHLVLGAWFAYRRKHIALQKLVSEFTTRRMNRYLQSVAHQCCHLYRSIQSTRLRFRDH